MANAEIGTGAGNAEKGLPESLLNAMSEIAWTASSDGALLWIHPAAKNLYGISAEELIQNPKLRIDAVHADDRQTVSEQLAALPRERCCEYDYRIVDTSGDVHRVLETSYYQSGDESEPASISGLTRIITERHDLEIALRDAEAVYRSLVESLPLSVLRKDAKGRIQYANAQACEQIGKSVDELIGKTDFDLFPADLAKKYMKDDRDVMQSGKLHHDVERHQAAGDKQIHVEVWKAPVHSARGEVVGIQAMFWDISDQRNAEHQVEFEKFLLATLLDTVPDSVYFKDAESRFIRLSRSCAKKFGLEDPRDALGKSDADFFTIEHARKAMADERKVMESGEPVLAEIEHETYEGGRETWCSTTKVPLKDKSGKVIGTFGISRDVTEQKRAEQELANERDLLKTIIDNVPDLIYVKDRFGRFITANAALLRLLKLKSAEELIGKTDYNFSPPELACNYVADDQIVMRNDDPLMDREESHRTEDGTEICLLTTKVPLKNNSGEVTGVVGIGHDITARKKADEVILAAKNSADKANRAKSDFLANMSHEIRTPMNAIIGMTDLVLDTKLDATQRNYLSMVQESGEALLSVINDILDFSKIEAGKLDIENRVFDIRESLGDTMKTLGLKAHAGGLELAFRVDPHVPRFAVGDVGRLRQVLVNLVGNSIKFTDHGEVVVEVADLPSAHDEVLLEIRVRDTGIGIPEEKCSKIFGEFEQADTSTTRRFGGTGLGLAISSRLVKLMGGEIQVTSEVDKGSEFVFCLTLGRAPEDFEQQKNRGVVVVGGTRVLVVDDNETNRRILQEMLSNWGMVPRLADSGDLAFVELTNAKQRGEPFGLVISDVNMPQMSGYDFVEKLRGDIDIADTQVIILTSGGRDGDYDLSDQLGIAERLMKPVKQSELFDAIVRCLGITSPEDGATCMSEDEGPDLGHLKVLLVEDNVINQKLAIGVLQRYGHDVTVANNGKEGVEAIEQDQFDVVLMDVQMPILDGFGATKMIREKEKQSKSGAHLPIIAMTAHAMKGDRERCIEAGMDDYVAKPIRINMLRDKLAAVLGLGDEAKEATQQVDPSTEQAKQTEQTESSVTAASGTKTNRADSEAVSDTHEPTDSSGTVVSQTGSPEVPNGSLKSSEDAVPEDQPNDDSSNRPDSSTPDVAGTCAIDWEHARLTVGGDEKLLSELLRVYIGEARHLMDDVRKAIDQENPQHLKRASHTLKGASMSVGALRTSNVAQRLEDVDGSDRFTLAQAMLSELDDAVEEVVAAANEHLSHGE